MHFLGNSYPLVLPNSLNAIYLPHHTDISLLGSSPDIPVSSLLTEHNLFFFSLGSVYLSALKDRHGFLQKKTVCRQEGYCSELLEVFQDAPGWLSSVAGLWVVPDGKTSECAGACAETKTAEHGEEQFCPALQAQSVLSPLWSHPLPSTILF